MDLDDLYRAVPAAQEEDLLEEVVHERLLSESEAWLRTLDPPEPPVVQDEPEPEEPPLTPGQVLGLVQHQLGAVVLPEEPEAE